MKTTDPPIELEFLYPVSQERVWNALTHLDEMLQWYFENIPDFKAEVGFETHFLISNEGRNFTHIWKVTEVIPKEKIVCNWTFKEYPGSSDLILELVANGDKALVRLKVVVRENFADDIPEFKRKSCEGGWNYFMGQNLKAYLEKAS